MPDLEGKEVEECLQEMEMRHPFDFWKSVLFLQYIKY